MDRSAVINLVSESYNQNANGVIITSEVYRPVYAQVESVTATEFFEGGRNGLNPEYRFTMFVYDYQGEKILEYGGERFFIYRTFRGKNDTIELYTERRQGNVPSHELIE